MEYRRMEEDGGSVSSVSIRATQSSPATTEKYSKELEYIIQELPGDRYEIPDTALGHVRLRVKKVIEHLIFRAITIALIIIDLVIGIADISLALNDESPAAVNSTVSPTVSPAVKALDYTSLVFSVYFVVEVALRIFARGPWNFFTKIWEVIDFVVIVVLFTLVVVALDVDPVKYARVFVVFRFVRIIRIAMVLRAVAHRKQLSTATRLTVSQNKRRYQQDGFDIDLCYVTGPEGTKRLKLVQQLAMCIIIGIASLCFVITPLCDPSAVDRVLAMSFPSSGTTSLYRNPIEEVSRFFKTKYSGHYKIYNLCSERHYEADKFFDSMVDRIPIDDHNVPSLGQMLEFCSNASKWMSSDVSNVMAIHCKGGKGRTGTLVCVWLLYSEIFDKAEDALEFFATRRTDLSVGSTFQGVETPSQSRYVGYFEKMKKLYNGKIPPAKKIIAKALIITGLRGIGKGDGTDLSVKLLAAGRNVVFEADFGKNRHCHYTFDVATSTATMRLIGAPELAGDIKVMFDTTSKNIPRGYEKCPFYFWFNTSFIDDTGRLALSRDQLDNPHKAKHWKLYKADFSVTLEFDLS